MKLIESKAEYIPQEEGLEGIYKQIELAGRTAYHSQDKITPDSAKDFVDRMIKSNHCYDGNTEVLTEKGWIKFSEYDEQRIAVINSDLSFKGFEKPSRVIKESYTGKFYKYPTLGIEVTDGHRMFGVFRESKNNFYNNSQYSLFECNTLYKDNNGKQKTLGERMFKTPSCCANSTNEDLKFELLGFWLGDGCYLPETKNNITFHLKRHRKIEYLKHLCQKLDYTFVEGKNNNYRVFKNGIGEEFCSNYYKDGNKYIPPMFFPSIEAVCSIFKGLINSDGSIYGNGRCSFSNTSLPLIEWVSSVGCLIGYNISEIGISRITTQDKPVYRVHILSTKYSINNDSRRENSKVIITDKTQTSYCVTVSTGLIMVRGSNKVTTICGNCAALEHGTVYLKVPVDDFNYSNSLWGDDIDDTFPFYSPWVAHEIDVNRIDYVTTNYRFFLETQFQLIDAGSKELFLEKYLCSPTELHEKRYTMRFTCSRAIAQELTRHRVFSFLMESQRYINYSKERHGGEITFIIPSWFQTLNEEGDYEGEIRDGSNRVVLGGKTFQLSSVQGFDEHYICSRLAEAENAYFHLLKQGYTPQQARDVLPNATKTELVVTGFASDWRHLFDLRLFGKTGIPHPDMVELMLKAQKAMQQAGIWEDVMSKPSKFE